MVSAIGQVLPLAVGVAVSPIPMVAVVLMLVTERARVNGPMFVGGWLVGLAIIGTIVLLVAGPADANDGGQPATWVGALQLVLGGCLVLVGIRQWRSRPRDGAHPDTPKWMEAVVSFTPLKAGGLGVVLSGANPKNLLLAVSAAVAITQTGISGSAQAGAYAVFMVIATIGVAIPVVVYFALGPRAKPVLDELKVWLIDNNAVIMAVLLLVISAKLIGDAVTNLA